MNSASAWAICFKSSYNRLNAEKRLKDYTLLAFACKWAGKNRDEGKSYYS